MYKLHAVILILSITQMVWAGEDDLYDFLWLDPDKSVYVLQNKIYQKDKSLYLDFGYLTSLTSTFQDTLGGQAKVGYYFKEEWAVEANYIQYSNTDNATFENVKSINGQVPFVRRPLSSTSLFLIWSPFYGKINTFNSIYYFDVSFGVGTGTYTMESNLDSVIESNSSNTYQEEEYTPVQLKTNMKFHVNKRMHLGIEFLSTNFEAKTDPRNKNKTDWKRNNDLIFSIGVSF